MQSPQVDTIVFDLGNVFVHVDELGAAEQIAEKTNKKPKDVHSEIFTLCDGIFDKFSIGAVTGDEFYDEVAYKVGYSGTYSEFSMIWTDMFSPIQSMIDLAIAIQPKVRRFLLSNTNELHCDYLLQKYTFLYEFDGLMFSHKVGVAKPDIRIYQLAEKEFKLDLDRTVFIDDRILNIEGAQNAGWTGIQFHTVDHLRQELTNLGLTHI